MSKQLRLNVQALARKDEEFMRCLLPPPGKIAVSNDLASGEPSVIAHFSRDKNYYDATFGMVGKEPYYDGDLLRIGSIYGMVASVSPIGKKWIKELYHTSFRGVPFPQEFAANPDVVKESDPKLYALHKIFCLGLGYSMGPRKLVTQAYDAGHVVDFKTSKEFFGKYWTLYGDVQKLGKMLEGKFNRDKYLVNPFGYRLKPDKPYKALNYYIQSSVSGIMHLLCKLYFEKAPWAEFVTIIHDELIQFIPAGREEEANELMRQAEKDLNAMLGWRVNIRVGWKSGKDLFEAK